MLQTTDQGHLVTGDLNALVGRMSLNEAHLSHFGSDSCY